MSKKSQTKESILKSAKTLFGSHGLTATTIDDILTACGITKGAFYHYFKSKDLLCETIIDNVTTEMHEITVSLKETSPTLKLREYLFTLANLADSGQSMNRKFIISITAEYPDLSTRIRQKITNFWQTEKNFYLNLLDKSKNNGLIQQEVETDIAAEIIISIMSGSLSMEKVLSQKLNFAEQAWTFVQMLRS
jgi:AcrR family transcriptional regulator